MIMMFNPNRLKRRNLTSLLGLSLDGSRLDGVVLRRTNGSLQVQQTFSVALSLDPLTADPELVGREIRNHLDAAEVRERFCIVGLPLKWALTTPVDLPDLPEADVASFLQIEAERGFPCDVETLLVSSSRCRPGSADIPVGGLLPGSQNADRDVGAPGKHSSGKQQALLVGIPKNHLILLEQALHAAKLRAVSFSLGVLALQPPAADGSNGVLALAIGESHVALQITCGGGVAALRTLEGALEVEGSRRRLQADVIAREARITLGQLPAELRDNVRRVRIFGPRELAQQLADEIELRLEPMGLKVELVTRYAPDEFGLQLPPEASISPALSLAAAQLAGRRMPLEFLPPKVTPWQQVAARYSSGKLRTAGALAVSVVLLVVAAFGIQQWQLAHWGSQWSAMASQVHELDAVQQQIHQFRPWFDDSLHGLNILKQLTTAFPEEGIVSAKTIEIRDLNAVTCTGTTRDSKALLDVVSRLRAAGISDVRMPSIRGSKPPLQFTFDFRSTEGGKVEN